MGRRGRGARAVRKWCVDSEGVRCNGFRFSARGQSMTGSYTPDSAAADSADGATNTPVCLSDAPARCARAGSPWEVEASPRPPTTQASTGGVNDPFQTSRGTKRRMAGQRSSARITLRSRRPHQRHPLAVQAPIHHPMIADESLMPNLASVLSPARCGDGTFPRRLCRRSAVRLVP